MAFILSIETSTSICSVALHENGNLIAIRENNSDKSHAKLIMQFIDEVLQEAIIDKQELKAVAIAAGPGSYTGLRIGTATAKGICCALEIPLIAISTLEALIRGAIDETKQEEAYYCAMLDARRMEVYCQLANESKKIVCETHAHIVDENSFKEQILDQKTYFFGDGAEKCKEVLDHPNAIFDLSVEPSADNIGKLAIDKYKNGDFENVAYYEPDYLKEVRITTPKKNILR